ncbi:TRAP transporter large permease [Desertibaculum subflavum]|uniref:TRAP transporter large permease n=1 Tax=Desertibaculum subflavum TaxID=2268458 RepID=UPI000E65EED2
MSIWIPCLLFLALLAIGMPIAFTLAATGALGVLVTFGWQPLLGVLATTPYRTASSFLLSTIPLFILMAEFLARGTIVRDMFRVAYTFMGHWRGGLALAAVGANVGFAALAGSSTAAAASMSRICVPEMRKYGYDDRLSLGTVAIAGTLAIMIPPSIGLIIYGILTETSIGRLFLGGVFPGLISAAGYAFAIWLWAKREPEVAPAIPRFPWSERIASLKSVWPAVLLIVFVTAAIYSGVVTPTEAAAVGALAALIISVAFGGLRWGGFMEAVRASVRTTAMIFAIIIGAMVFGYFLAGTKVPQHMIEWVGSLPVPSWVIIAVIVGIYLLLGCFMDQLAIIVLTLPLTFPLVTSLGYDAVWWGIIVTKTAEIGLVTPPLGLNVFVAAGSVNAPLETAFAGIGRLLTADAVVLLALLLLPEISTFLPDLLMGVSLD